MQPWHIACSVVIEQHLFLVVVNDLSFSHILHCQPRLGFCFGLCLFPFVKDYPLGQGFDSEPLEWTIGVIYLYQVVSRTYSVLFNVQCGGVHERFVKL